MKGTTAPGVLIAVVWLAGGGISAAAPAPSRALLERLPGAHQAPGQERLAAIARFRAEQPAAVQSRNGAVSRIYGQPFGEGSSPLVAAETFLDDHADMFGMSRPELAVRRTGSGPRQQPLMYRPETDSYKFTLLTYDQVKAGLPVFRSELRLLVRNAPEFPLVWAGSTLHDLSAYGIDPDLGRDIATAGYVAQRFAQARDALLADHAELSAFDEPRVTIWAGIDGKPEPPRVALTFHGDNRRGADDRNWLFVVDIETGEVLYRESRLFDLSVSGNVSGLATSGAASDQCEPEVATPLPYVEVFSGAESAFSDGGGDFTIANGGATVDAGLDGIWFNVIHYLGPETTESEPSTFDLLFNSTNDDEYVRAQVNAYVQANRVRNFVLDYNPVYPTMTDTDILVRANRNDSLCPGNAWYSNPDGGSPTHYSLNFCESSTNRPNTAYSSVVHHEFGHHVVEAGGSGQGAYGEGMGDVFSALILDTPLLGQGFFNNCNGALRNADNTIQYPCNGDSHFCGQLLSGAVWSTRNKLVDSNPLDYTDVLGALAVNAVLLHGGSSIDPDITVDYLTLDDDDGILLNGTPHYDQIDAGFGAHGMAGPPVQSGLSVLPVDDVFVSGPAGGPFTPPTKDYTLQNIESVTLDYSVTADVPWLAVANASGSLAPGATTTVTVSVDAPAFALPAGYFAGTLTFTNLTTHEGDTTRGAILAADRMTYDAGDTPQPLPVSSTTVSTISVGDSFCIGDVDVLVDISSTVTEGLTVDLESPQGTVVRLHDLSPGTDILTTYDEQGGTAPDGPGALSDFLFEDVSGDWTLTVANISVLIAGTLNDWKLHVTPLGPVCPPVAHDVSATVPGIAPQNVTLDGQSNSGNPLSYVVVSLPARGTLSDPNGGTITALPHVLAAGGNSVTYQTTNGFLGPDAFEYRVNDGLDSAAARVDLKVGGLQNFAQFRMQADPGWVATGGWAFGQPTGGGAHAGDPSAGATGLNVYGYNLNGDYANNMGVETLTSTPIDLSGAINTVVRFSRWLGVENGAFDGAAFQVSTDGALWTTIWNHTGGTLDESAWSLQEYDVSSIADRQPTVYLRWIMGATDSTETYAGWNLDDVLVLGMSPPESIDLTVSRSDLSWTALAGASSYDLVRGDLGLLRAGGGDFAGATAGCVGNDVGATTLAFSDDPSPGEGLWILVRGNTGTALTTYDSFAVSQVGLRDAEIGTAPGTCP